MKKLSVKKEILLVIMVIAVVFAISSSVFATNSPVQIPITGGTPQNTTTENTTTENTTTENTVVTPNTNQNTTANTTGSTYQNTTLPQTGDASDYAIFGIMVVAAVIAIYAYRKVREYNI